MIKWGELISELYSVNHQPNSTTPEICGIWHHDAYSQNTTFEMSFSHLVGPPTQQQLGKCQHLRWSLILTVQFQCSFRNVLLVIILHFPADGKMEFQFWWQTVVTFLGLWKKNAYRWQIYHSSWKWANASKLFTTCFKIKMQRYRIFHQWRKKKLSRNNYVRQCM